LELGRVSDLWRRRKIQKHILERRLGASMVPLRSGL